MSKSKWKDPKTANELINRIVNIQAKEKNTSSLLSGFIGFKSQFDSIKFDVFSELLKEQVRFNKEIPLFNQNLFFRKSLFKAADEERLNTSYVSDNIKILETDYLNKPKREYVFITRISLSGLKRTKKTKTPNSEIIFSKQCPKCFKKHYNFEEAKSLFPNTDGYNTWVSVHVIARCEHSASGKALDELGYYLGIINLIYNFNKSRRSSGTKIKPINKIRKYPYHSLHYDSGERATNLYWYEPNFSEIGDVIFDDDDFIKVNKLFKKISRDILKTSRYEYFNEVFNNYTDSLETNDLNKSFKMLWSILETLTLSSKDNYDVTINRALVPFSDKFIVKMQLEMLREKRNIAVHTNRQFENAEQLTYMLLNIINNYIQFMIRLSINIKNEKQIKQVIDLPTDSDKLFKKINDLNSQIENINSIKNIMNI